MYITHNRITHNRNIYYIYRVKKYLFANIHPLQQLQTLLSTLPRISGAISDAINVIMPSFTTWTSYESMKSGQYFSLSQENPSTYSMPIDEKKIELYQDASYLDHIGTWIIYLYLIFPESLNDEIPRAQLTAALNDRTVVILYRDELIDAIHEYQALEKTSRQEIKVPKQHIKKVISLSSSKQKIIDNISGLKTDALTSRHRQMRELLRREIRGLLDVANAIPGIIPVKLPMFMASLALSRYEIYWVFTHMSLKNNKTKLNFAAPFLPDLMFHCFKLSQTILKNKDLIYKYYSEQLKLDIQEIIPFAQQMRKLSKLDISVLDLVDNIIKQISRENNDKMEGLRLSWYRASAEMSKEPSVFRLPQGQAMAKLVNPLIQHTRYYDRLEKEVDARGSMATLWFYRSYLAQIFNTYCLGRFDNEEKKSSNHDYNDDQKSQYQDISSNKNNKNIPYNRQGRYWIVFLQVYSQSLHNVHRQRPEELNIIGLGSLQKAEAYLNATTSKIEVCIRNILGQYSKFNAQIHPETVADHLIKHRGGNNNQDGNNNNNNSSRNRGGWKSLPGFESFYPNRQYLETLKHNLDIVGDICSSFAEIDSILIHNQKIYPSAYLYQLMYDFFFNEIRLMAQESPKTMVRPQRFLSRLDRLFRACSRIGQYINLDLENMIKQILYDDFYDDSVGIAGVSLGMPSKKKKQQSQQQTTTTTTNGGEAGGAATTTSNGGGGGGNNEKPKRKLIHDIRDWYVGIVDSRCAAPNSNSIWSPLLYGFYESKIKSGVALENYCSITELESLCKLIGPSGVRVIDLEVLKIGHAAMQSIKQVLEKNRDLIGGVDMYKFHSYDRWHSIVKRFNGLDIISQQGVVIGSVILFRKLLRKALYNTLSSSSLSGSQNGFYSSTMKVICDKFFHERIFFESISDLALDTGIVNDFTDNVMRNVYYQLANNDSKLWSYIPLVFGICFSDSFWLNNDVYYNIKLGALSNNGFTLANAISEMITIYTEQSKHRKNKLLFLDIAGKSLLYLKKQYPNNKSINSLFLFLDYFIEINQKDLTHMDLQSFSVPYDVIRAQIVKTLGDESGLFSDYTFIIDDDTTKSSQPIDNSGDDEQKTQ